MYKRQVSTGGVVFGAFADKELKGFAAVLPEIFGGENQYMDLAAIHVSQDMRGSGIGSCLLGKAKEWAKEKGAKKLYISAHSAVESLSLIHISSEKQLASFCPCRTKYTDDNWSHKGE